MKYVPPKDQSALGENGQYKDVDMIIGEPGSIVPAIAIEMLLREMHNTIKLTGLIPSETDLTQLYTALTNFGMGWSDSKNYYNVTLVIGSDNTLYKLLKPSGPDIKDDDDDAVVIGPKDPISNEDYWVRFNTFKASDVAYLDIAIAEILDTIDGVSTRLDSLASVHTSTGLATTNKAGHVIPGKTVTLDGATGTINVKIDSETIRSKADGTLYAEVPTSLTSETPLTIDNDVIKLGIDNNTLIIKNNKLVVNPAVLSDDDGDGNPITINGALLNELNRLRMLSIGRPIYHTSIDLPDDHVWVDGSFISFEDRPEFARRYLDGAFNGMLLEWNATEEDIDKNPGKFRKNAANPTGLYLPKNGGDFYRLWNSTVTDVTAGSKNEAGLPNIEGDITAIRVGDLTEYSGALIGTGNINGAAGNEFAYSSGLTTKGQLSFDASKSNPIYGNNTTVMPESTNIPVIMYLGKTEALNEVFYNNGTQQLPIASGDELGVIKVDNSQFTVDKHGTLHLNGFVPTSTAPNREILTTSGTYTVEHSGWYKIICIGGGGSGGSNCGTTASTNLGYGGLQGGTTTFGNYLSAIGGSGGGGNAHSYYGSGGGGAGEINEQYVFLDKDEKIQYSIGLGALGNTTVLQNGQGPTGGRTILAAYQAHGTGALGAGDGNLANTATEGVLEAGGRGGDGAPSPYGYGAGGGGASGNGVGTGGGTGGKGGSTLATAGEDGVTGNVKKSGGAGASGAIIIDCMSILQGSVNSNVTPTKAVITTNSQYTPEVTGWHEITLIGGGGGGGADPGNIVSAISGGGGGSGERKTVFKYLRTREPITISIGRGGIGATIDTEAEDGFPTTVTIDGEIITSEGGHRGIRYLGGQGGGSGHTAGLAGHNGSVNTYGDGNSVISTPGGIGGGNNSGFTTYYIGDDGPTILKVNATGYGSGGGGGWGGNSSNPLRSGGSNGCHGAVIIQKMAFGGSQDNGSDIEIATPDKEGLVKPDDKSIKIKSDGTLYIDEIYGIAAGKPYREVLTTTGTWTAPHTGYFKVTCIGGGGGGAGGSGISDAAYGGGGGSSGQVVTETVYLKKDQECSCTIGLGGIGGAKNTTDVFNKGYSGGTTTFVSDQKNITATGGNAAGPSTLADGATSASPSDCTVRAISSGMGSLPGSEGGINKGVVGVSAGSGNGAKINISGNVYGSGGHGSRGLTTSSASYRIDGIYGEPGAIIIESIAGIAGPINNQWLNDVNSQRLLTIGRPVHHTSSTLPEDHAWCDGSFVKFSDRPELKIKYESGGFDGMLLAWDADSATIANNMGKWRPDAAVPTGLYLPSDGNSFYRSWNTLSTGIEPGSKNEAGLPNITGTWKPEAGVVLYTNSPVSGAFYLTDSTGTYRIAGTPADGTKSLGFNASKSNSIYGNSITVMPESINIPVIVYLGKDKIDNTIWYNPELNGTLTNATSSKVGLVKPDNTTTEVNDNGEISVKQQTLKTEFMSDVNYLRKLSIGRPVHHTSSTLPEDHAWCDGSFISFTNRPELKEKYESNGFSGMILPWNASPSDIASNRGKFRPDKATPTGLYLPSDGGKFYRSWNSSMLVDSVNAGTYNSAGLPNITGDVTGIEMNANGAFAIVNDNVQYAGGDTIGATAIFDASRSNPIYGNSTTVMPESINIPVIVYLGKTTLGNSVFYDDTPSKKRHNHPLLDTFYSPLENIDGCLSMSIDHGLLSRTGLYAEAWSAIEKQAGTMLIDDADWLAEVAANGVCGKFSKGDGSTTFRIPYIARMYLRSTGDDLPNGNYHNDAIRNITGTLGIRSTNHEMTGVFGLTKNTSSGLTGTFVSGDTATSLDKPSLDASLQIPTADENRTKAIAWIPYISLFGVSPLVAQIDTANLAVEIDKIRHFIGQLSFGFPDAANAEELVFTTTGMKYTPSKNGWLYAVGNSTASNQYISINNGAFSKVVTATGAGGSGWPVSIQVTSGTECIITWDMTLTNLRFIPATNIAPKGTPTSDYSTTETWTGGRWIDGKKIYRLVYRWDSAQSFAANTWLNTPIAIGDKDVFISGKLLNTNKSRTHNFVSYILIGSELVSDTFVKLYSNDVVLRGDTLIIEYTKKVDD